MPNFGIFEASISVDGTELPEYNVTINEQSRTVACWIPSEVGKAFSIKIRNTNLHPTLLACDLFIDGNHLEKTVLSNTVCTTATLSDVVTSSTTSRELIFSSVELTDDDAFLDTANVKDLGDISLKIFEVLQFRDGGVLPETTRVADGKVHERTKKAMGHRVGLGREKNTKSYQQTFTIEKVGNYLANFLFKYRPIAILRADGIVHAESPDSPNLKGKRKADDDGDGNRAGNGVTRDEEHSQVLNPTRLSANKPNKRVKTESQRPIIPREVIDLT